jgi:hypothetical protein
MVKYFLSSPDLPKTRSKINVVLSELTRPILQNRFLKFELHATQVIFKLLTRYEDMHS